MPVRAMPPSQLLRPHLFYTPSSIHNTCSKVVHKCSKPVFKLGQQELSLHSMTVLMTWRITWHHWLFILTIPSMISLSLRQSLYPETTSCGWLYGFVVLKPSEQVVQTRKGSCVPSSQCIQSFRTSLIARSSWSPILYFLYPEDRW